MFNINIPRRTLIRLRLPPGIGLLLLSVVLLNGAVVATFLNLSGSRGPFPSMERLLAIAAMVLFTATNIPNRIFRRVLDGNLMFAFTVLILLFPLAALRGSQETSRAWLVSHLPQVLVWSSLGVFATMLQQAGSEELENERRIYPIACTATVMLWGVLIWIAYAGLSSIRTDVFLVTVADGEYYQILGDTLTFGLMAVIALQLQAFRIARIRRAIPILLFVAAMIAQAILASIILQLFGSNKGPLLVFVCLLFAMLEAISSPPSKTRKRNQVTYVISFLVICALLLQVIADLELPLIRMLDFDAGGELLNNTSVRSRNEFLRDSWQSHLFDSPLLGNPMIGVVQGDYIHSSFLSLQTNFGLLGTLLVSTVLLIGWGRINNKPELAFLRIVYFPIIIVSAISTFFTWGPLWMLLASLAITSPTSRRERMAAEPESHNC
jgi:hypothetical protein